MELGLSLGNETTSSKPPLVSSKNSPENSSCSTNTNKTGTLSFCMALGVASANDKLQNNHENGDHLSDEDGDHQEQGASLQNPLQLNLLPFDPVPRSTPWSSDNASSDNGSSGNRAVAVAVARGMDLTRQTRIGGGGVEEVSSANSVAALPIQIEFTSFDRNSTGSGIISEKNKRDFEAVGNDTVDAEIADLEVAI